MRYSLPLLMICSGLMVATSTLSVQVAVAGQTKTGTRVVAALDSQVSPQSEGSTKVVCSRNHTLQVSADGTKVAALPEGLTWASNIVQLFCREVRINMILVKDYCAVIR